MRGREGAPLRAVARRCRRSSCPAGTKDGQAAAKSAPGSGPAFPRGADDCEGFGALGTRRRKIGTGFCQKSKDSFLAWRCPPAEDIACAHVCADSSRQSQQTLLDYDVQSLV